VRVRGSGHEVAAAPQREALGVRAIVATAARAGRRNVWRVLAVALVVSLATAVTEIVVDNVVDPTNNLLSSGGFLSAQAVSMFGTVLLAGFLCRLVSTDERRSHDVTIGRVLLTLPWVSLLVADVLASALFIAGLVALVIPGLVIFNLLAIVGPVIEIERRSAVSGLRRSARLVRPHFWPVALLAGAPLLVLATVESSLPDPHSAMHIVEVLTIRGILVALMEAGIGLVQVVLCYRLIDLDSRLRAAGA
jgi:hypothetical protein